MSVVNIRLGINAIAGGTADVITITYDPAFSEVDSSVLFFRASGANTTNVTLNANATGAKALTQKGGTALAAGMIPGANYLCVAEYNLAADRFELANPFPIFGTTANTWCQGNDSRLSNSRNTSAVFKSMVDASHTGDTVETKIFSVLIPAGTYQTGDFIERYIEWGATSNGNNKLIRTYYNETDDLVSPTLAATNSVTASGVRLGHTRLLEVVDAASDQRCLGPTTTTPLYTTNQSVGLSNLGLDFQNNSYYLIVTLALANSADTATLISIYERIIR